MKKTKIILLGLVISSFTVLMTGCSKSEGCTDVDALNYDADAQENDGSCEYPTGAFLKVNANMTSTLASSGCYSTGAIWKVKITSGPVAVAEKTFSINVNNAAYEGTVTLDGFTQSGTYYFDIIDDYGDVVEGGSNFFSSTEVENGSTDTKTESISTTDAGC